MTRRRSHDEQDIEPEPEAEPSITYEVPTFDRLEAHPLSPLYDLQQDEMRSLNHSLKALDDSWAATTHPDEACRLARTITFLLEKRRVLLNKPIGTGKADSSDPYDDDEVTFGNEASAPSHQSARENSAAGQDERLPPLRSAHEDQPQQLGQLPSGARNRSQTH